MSVKIRSLKQQLQYTVSKNEKIGTPKRTDKMNPQNLTKSLFGVHRVEDIRKLASTFAKFLKEHHPEVRLVTQITPEMAQEFIHERAFLGDGWTISTGLERESQLHVLSQLARQTFQGCKDFAAGITAEYKRGEPVRVLRFVEEHVEAVKNSFLARGSRSAGYDAVEIAARVGLRSEGCAYLKPECIELDKRRIFVTREMAKGGRERYVPIQDEDYEYFRALKERTAGREYCLGVQPESLSRAVRREMKRITVEVDGVAKTLDELYPGTTLHAIRKYWANKRYINLLAERGVEPASPKYDVDCRAVWEIVRRELGHGKALRMDLFLTYVGEVN